MSYGTVDIFVYHIMMLYCCHTSLFAAAAVVVVTDCHSGMFMLLIQHLSICGVCCCSCCCFQTSSLCPIPITSTRPLLCLHDHYPECHGSGGGGLSWQDVSSTWQCVAMLGVAKRVVESDVVSLQQYHWFSALLPRLTVVVVAWFPSHYYCCGAFCGCCSCCSGCLLLSLVVQCTAGDRCISAIISIIFVTVVWRQGSPFLCHHIYPTVNCCSVFCLMVSPPSVLTVCTSRWRRKNNNEMQKRKWENQERQPADCCLFTVVVITADRLHSPPRVVVSLDPLSL